MARPLELKGLEPPRKSAHVGYAFELDAHAIARSRETSEIAGARVRAAMQGEEQSAAVVRTQAKPILLRDHDDAFYCRAKGAHDVRSQ